MIKRRTRFAAPYVLVGSLLAPACATSRPPIATNPPPSTEPPVEPEASPDELPPAPVGDGAWREVDGHWQFAYSGGSVLHLTEAGTCVVAPDTSCGAGDTPATSVPTCNPPPPYQVACPPGTPTK